MLECALVNDDALQTTPQLRSVKQQFDFAHDFVSQESAGGMVRQFSFGTFYTIGSDVRCTVAMKA